jgi:uncharacterized protein (TIGR00251 family)
VAATIRLTAVPASRKNELFVDDGGVRVKIAARAIDGKANAELVRFLAQTLGVSRSRVVLVQGTSSKHKVLEIDGLTHEEVVGLLSASAHGREEPDERL